MNVVITFCVVILSVVAIIVAIELIDTLKRIKSAAQSLEMLSRDIDERVKDTEPAFKMVNSISTTINSFFYNIVSWITSFLRKNI
mgnify:CR=1 FL=1